MEVDGIGRLSRELIIDILSRLPVKVVCKFRCVSKQWLNFTSDPYFLNLHRNRSQKNLLFLDWRHQPGAQINSKLVHLSIMDMKGAVHSEHKFVTNDFIWSAVTCSRLILLNGSNHTYVCNPTTGEYISIFDHSRLMDHGQFAIYDLGFLPSTNEYKIIHLFNSKFSGRDDYHNEIPYGTYPNREIQHEIYTLQNGGVLSSCRKVQVSWPTRSGPRFGSVCVNGVLYYRMEDRFNSTVKIMSFDMEKEEFGTVLDPPLLSGHSVLKEFNSVLYFVAYFTRTPTIDMWVLKDDTNQKSRIWEKECTIDFSTFDGFPDSAYYNYKHESGQWPVLVSPVDIQNGEILLEVKRESFHYYNIEDKSFRRAEFSKPQLYVKPCVFFESIFSLGSGGNQLFSNN